MRKKSNQNAEINKKWGGKKSRMFRKCLALAMFIKNYECGAFVSGSAQPVPAGPKGRSFLFSVCSMWCYILYFTPRLAQWVKWVANVQKLNGNVTV